MPVALITGRRNDSLERILLAPILKRAGSEHAKLLSRIFVYPFNGAMGYRLDCATRLFFDRPLPAYLASATMNLIRDHFLEASDRYDVTDYKITVLPHNKGRQLQLVRGMNDALALAMIPVRAQTSGSIRENAAIVLTSTEANSRAGKAVALEDFAKRVGCDTDLIAKVGDQASATGVDHELLVGRGSFSTESFDPRSEQQVDIPSLCGKRNLDAFLWLLPQLRFQASPGPDPRHSGSSFGALGE